MNGPSLISHADWLKAVRLLGIDDPEGWRQVAALLGLELPDESARDELRRPPRRIEREPLRLLPDKPLVHGEPPETTPQFEAQPAEFLETLPPDGDGDDAWIETLSTRSVYFPKWLTDAVGLPTWSGDGELTPPPIDPLFQPAWTRTLLHAALATGDRDAGEIDEEQTVEKLVRAEPLTSVPRLSRLRLRDVQVLVDVGESMRPFAEDQDAILKDIKHVMTAQMVQELAFEECPSRGAGRRDEWPRGGYRPPSPGTVVLLLTDFGVGYRGGPGALLGEWQDFAASVLQAGCPLVALAPYAPADIAPSLRRLIAVIPWDRATTTGLVRRLRLDADRRSSP
jgi:hypothetical protein